MQEILYGVRWVNLKCCVQVSHQRLPYFFNLLGQQYALYVILKRGSVELTMTIRACKTETVGCLQ